MSSRLYGKTLSRLVLDLRSYLSRKWSSRLDVHVILTPRYFRKAMAVKSSSIRCDALECIDSLVGGNCCVIKASRVSSSFHWRAAVSGLDTMLVRALSVSISRRARLMELSRGIASLSLNCACSRRRVLTHGRQRVGDEAMVFAMTIRS